MTDVNVDFFIKQGDQLPAFEATLVNDLDQPIDLTGSAVAFLARNAQTGAMVVDGVMDIIGAPANGVVRYNWVDADTADAGTLLAEVQVSYPGADVKPLSVPNDGYFVIQVTKELALEEPDPAIDRLRGMVGDRIPSDGDDSDSFWTTAQLNLLLTSAGGDLDVAALWAWQEKAAEFSALYDKDESGSSHKLSNLFKQAMNMVEHYKKTIVENTSSRVSGRVVAKVASMISCPHSLEFVEGSPFSQGDVVRTYPLHRFRAVLR